MPLNKTCSVVKKVSAVMVGEELLRQVNMPCDMISEMSTTTSNSPKKSSIMMATTTNLLAVADNLSPMTTSNVVMADNAAVLRPPTILEEDESIHRSISINSTIKELGELLVERQHTNEDFDETTSAVNKKSTTSTIKSRNLSTSVDEQERRKMSGRSDQNCSEKSAKLDSSTDSGRLLSFDTDSNSHPLCRKM